MGGTTPRRGLAFAGRGRGRSEIGVQDKERERKRGYSTHVTPISVLTPVIHMPLVESEREPTVSTREAVTPPWRDLCWGACVDEYVREGGLEMAGIGRKGERELTRVG